MLHREECNFFPGNGDFDRRDGLSLGNLPPSSTIWGEGVETVGGGEGCRMGLANIGA